MNYRKAYAQLVAGISDAIDELEKVRIPTREIESVVDRLKMQLLAAEEEYITSTDDEATP